MLTTARPRLRLDSSSGALTPGTGAAAAARDQLVALSPERATTGAAACAAARARRFSSAPWCV